MNYEPIAVQFFAKIPFFIQIMFLSKKNVPLQKFSKSSPDDLFQM